MHKKQNIFSPPTARNISTAAKLPKNNDVVIPLEKEFDAQQTNDDANPLIKELFVFLD